MRRSRKIIMALLALNLVFGTLLSSAFAAVPQDAQKHWASTTLQKWVESGLIKGYKDGSVKPDVPIKRSEFVALLNRALKLSDAQNNLTFGDLPTTNWAYGDFAIAVKAGYLQGTGGKAYPNRLTTRQEAAVMIAKAFKLDSVAGEDVSVFKDADQIASWSKDAITSLATNNVLKGDTKGNLRPQAAITRAEAVVAIDAALALKPAATAKVFDKAGVYGSTDKTETIEGDVVIAADNVTLQNMVITGNLTVSAKVGDGDVTLKHVTVKGTTHVNGGGENSIHVEDSVLLRVIVDKASGKVRIVAIGETKVYDVIVQSAVKLEESNVTDSGFANVELAKDLPKDASVDLIGKFEDVRVLAANIKINIPSGSVDNLVVADGAANNTINVSKEAQVLKLVLDAVSKLIGDGKIENATINEKAKGSEFANQPANVDGDGKDGIKVSKPVNPNPGTGPVTNPGTGPGTNPGTGSEHCTGNAANTAECDNARLSAVSVTSSVYDQFQLVQRDGSKNIFGTGFSSDALYYSVGVPRNIAESDVAVSVTAATYAKISYSLTQNDGTYRFGFLQNGQNTINVHLKPLEDAHLFIFVTSGNDKSTKVYEIQFVYDRDLQEAFYIQKDFFYGAPYQLVSQSLEEGDVVTVTIPATDHASRQETIVTDTVYYNRALILLNGFEPALPQGNLHVTVVREGRLIMDGEYAYDLTPAQVVTNGNGIEISLWTKAELTAHDQQSYDMNRSNYGYKFQFNAQAIAANPQLANAKYFSFKWNNIEYQHSTPTAWTKEAVKFSWNRFWAVHELVRIDQFVNKPYTHLFLGSAPIEKVHNQFMYVFAFDANKQLIGYYVHTVNFDADHVGSHVTLVPPQP
ncbi:S-layer homology domain-containing protein [Cohnella terricola]|uniref:S-layer homology domain-containing protein n=1 Tax=Cohnella terricola TaxID=1289167 RepID=A0A559J9U0_9BACL|nr:S-layer homology domain-containing protein [Cohnella terricola]TVX96636.1 S-layer homology domain-containing protein [Cohnella terricola]